MMVEFELIALRCERVLDRIGLDHALAAHDGDALEVRRAYPVDDLVTLGAGAEEHAHVEKVGEGRGGADRLDPVDQNALVIGRDDAQGRRGGVRAGIGAVDLRVDEMRRDDQVVVHRVLPEVADVVGKPAPFGTDRMLLPRLRIVDIGDQHVVLRVGRARHRRGHEVLHDEFEVFALADQLFLVAMLVPRHRAPRAALVDEGEEILQVSPVVQVEEFGGALRIVAGQRVRRDIVDLLVADPDDAAVVERREILLAGSQHADPPRLAAGGFS